MNFLDEEISFCLVEIRTGEEDKIVGEYDSYEEAFKVLTEYNHNPMMEFSYRVDKWVLEGKNV